VERSLPSRGAWIETYVLLVSEREIPGRSLHGERGLKRRPLCRGTTAAGSLPSRGAWIETLRRFFQTRRNTSLPSRGAWIETGIPNVPHSGHRRSLHGERGLKHAERTDNSTERWSLPSRGAWIETTREASSGAHFASLPSRGAWIETHLHIWNFDAPGMGRSLHGERGLKLAAEAYGATVFGSLPSRGAWIETLLIFLFAPSP